MINRIAEYGCRPEYPEMDRSPTPAILDRMGCFDEEIDEAEWSFLQEPLQSKGAEKRLAYEGLTFVAMDGPLDQLHGRLLQHLRIEYLEVQVAKIPRMEAEIAELYIKFERLAASLPAATGSYDPKLADVLELTASMFGERPSAALMRDPEDPEFPFVVVTVKGRGEPSKLLDRSLEWHDRISTISPGNSGAFRLSIIPE